MKVKKNLLVSVFVFTFFSFSCIYAQGIKLGTNVKFACPIDFGEKQLDYYSLSPVAEIKIAVPLYKNFGMDFSADFLWGSFRPELFDTRTVGNYQFYSVFAGVFYCINVSETFCIVPEIGLGYSYAKFHLNSERDFPDSLFCLQAAVSFEKKINQNWALNAITSFGYYNVYCPLAFGVGAAYNF